jgi:hypothetical protein
MNDARDLLGALRERAKELGCLYEVEKALAAGGCARSGVLAEVVKAIPPGWQYPETCGASVRIEDDESHTENFHDSPWVLRAPILVQDDIVGELRVCYSAERPVEDDGPFLNDEIRLIHSLADRLGHWVLFCKLESMGRKWRELGDENDATPGQNWRVLIELLRETDDALFLRVSRKMLNHLCSIGIVEAQEVLREIDQEWDPFEDGTGETNVPEVRKETDHRILATGRPFDIAGRHLAADDIIKQVQKWVQADKASQFLKILDNPSSTLIEVREALRRFHQLVPGGEGLPESTLKSVRVAMSQRILTEQIDFIQAAKDEVSVEFFIEILDRIVTGPESHGKLGGKASGMLLAHRVLQNRGAMVAGESKSSDTDAPLADVRLPRTWYIASDAVLDFINYNDLEDVLHQKYKSIDEIRRDYPNIIRLFKNSTFPPSLVQGLSAALDDFAGVPVIIRSSSLLEDRVGSAFSGKYKSLFLANQGDKQERLAAMLDAVAEVYASMFGPDPIQYRRERGVLEFDEQMGILIQEVVGKKVADYFFPSFAGVAFSRNEFRWSPRITREDGLVRLVPGLGTRAVDRIGDDYPVLLVPGKPELRANVAVDEVMRYAPRSMDVVNLKTNRFETVEVSALLDATDGEYPGLTRVFCRLEDGRLTRPVSTFVDESERSSLVACFEGLRGSSKFVNQIREALIALEEVLGNPVDVEFAHDGDHLYLLQCRPQSQSDQAAPSPIPRDISEGDIVFSASKYVSNGRIGDINHLVYVDPERYAALGSRAELKAVGRAVSELNKLLPKKQFILMGPGRWGSRGDIKLGVAVTYADINNTAMLIEIARRSGDYVPDVSFGTHFFQDLVESAIGYLPLYPDDEGIHFGERFLTGSNNILADLLPEFAHLAEVVRVIDVPTESEGRTLRVLLNADLDEAVAYLDDPGAEPAAMQAPAETTVRAPDRFWRWRKQMAERIAAELDRERFGVKAIYLFGSVKNATAGPSSDIDLLLHVDADRAQRRDLGEWLDGWSRALAEFNYQRTGYRTDGLLDVHLVTDDDIARRSSYAVKIGAVTDAATELPV